MLLDRSTARLRGDVCELAACRSELAREAADATARRHWSETLRRSHEQIAEAAADVIAAARELGLPADRVVPAALPLLARPMVPLGADNRRLMTRHLDQIVAEAFETGIPDEVTRDRDELEAPVSPYLAAACATCNGACCEVGRSYRAFLTAETVGQYRRHVPELSPDEVRDRYLQRLPQEIVEGSCFFHGQRGCTLDREQRDDVCHRHLCQQIHAQRDAGIMRQQGPFVMIAADQHGNRAVTLYDPADGARALPDGPRPDPGQAEAERIAESAVARFPAAPPATRPRPPARMPLCGWCGRPITPAQAATTGSCGDPGCERARRHKDHPGRRDRRHP